MKHRMILFRPLNSVHGSEQEKEKKREIERRERGKSKVLRLNHTTSSHTEHMIVFFHTLSLFLPLSFSLPLIWNQKLSKDASTIIIMGEKLTKKREREKKNHRRKWEKVC